MRLRIRLVALLFAVVVGTACNSDDNGGVIEGPLDTSPDATQGP